MSEILILEGTNSVGKHYLGKRLADILGMQFYRPTFDYDKYPPEMGRYDDLVLSSLHFTNLKLIEHRSFLSNLAFNSHMEKYFSTWQNNIARWSKSLIVLLDYEDYDLLARNTGLQECSRLPVEHQQNLIRECFYEIDKVMRLHLHRRFTSDDLDIICDAWRKL